MPANPATAKSRRMFIFAGYGTIFAAFLGLSLVPYFRDVANIQKDIEAREQEIATRQNKKNLLEDVTKKVELLNLQVRKFDRLVPSNQDLGPFLAQLSHELDNSGMKEISVRNLAANPLGKSQQLPIEVSGNGTFLQFHSFLTHLESLPRMSSVSQLLVEADTAMTGNVHVQLRLSIYNTKPN